jgi:hypothetical protein
MCMSTGRSFNDIQICASVFDKLRSYDERSKGACNYLATCKEFTVRLRPSGFGALVVSMLASGTHGFAPGRSRRIFSGKKILSMTSFGKEVKPFAPCRRFAECQRTL